MGRTTASTARSSNSASASRGNPGREEYIDSEKYEIRSWNLADQWSLAPLIIARECDPPDHPALRQDRTLRFHATDNERLIAYSKSHASSDTVLVVVNLDPHYRQSGFVTLDPEALGLPSDAQFQVHDLLGDGRFTWQGARNYVELDPHMSPVHIFALRNWSRSEQNFEYYLDDALPATTSQVSRSKISAAASW